VQSKDPQQKGQVKYSGSIHCLERNLAAEQGTPVLQPSVPERNFSESTSKTPGCDGEAAKHEALEEKMWGQVNYCAHEFFCGKKITIKVLKIFVF
jgi:hypothetical protein